MSKICLRPTPFFVIVFVETKSFVSDREEEPLPDFETGPTQSRERTPLSCSQKM